MRHKRLWLERKTSMSEITNNEPEKKETEITPEKKEELQDVDQLEKETLDDLDTLREANNEANDDVIDETRKQLEKIFADLRTWIKENSDPQVVKAHLQKAADDCANVLNQAKAAVIEVAESEQFKKTMEAGKDFMVGTGTLIANGLKAGADQLMKNPNINKAVTQIDEKLDTIRDNENVKEAVNKTQEALEKMNTAIFNGIRSFFDHPDRKPEEEKPAAEVPPVPVVKEDEDLPASEEK